jgi:predicted MPP superfamily phosphohydrolase
MNNKLALTLVLISIVATSCVIFYAFYNKRNFNSETATSNKLFTQDVESKELLFSFIVISDTHLNLDAYQALKTYLIDSRPSFIVHLGDHTNFGTIKELQQAKKLLDELNTPYYTLAGDHDIAETSSMENYNKVFSLPVPIKIKELNISFLNNPYNVLPFKSAKLSETKNSIFNSDIILASQPIFVDKDNFFSYKFMGSQDNIGNLSPGNQSLLKIYSAQSKEILDTIRLSTKNKLIIGGDHHRSATYTDPTNHLLTYHVVGALSKSIYLGSKEIPQKSLQSQRFSVIKVFKNENGFEYTISEQIIDN